MNHYLRDFDAYLRGHGVVRFTARELCNVGRKAGDVELQAPPCDLWDRIIPTALLAQEAREHFGAPMTVNSGYRDLAYNRAVGSTDGSVHVQFRAMDIVIPGVTPARLYGWLDRHPEWGGKIGLGRYPTFVHLDCRGHRARW
jgi:uncharacterized protein YcbK (DUF882 family)